MLWFKHDSNASTDAKLKKVKIKYGMSGYGLYWHCLELICSDFTETNITFQLEHDAEIIAFDTGINVQLVNEMMAFMINLQLFEESSGVITCLKMAKRFDKSMTSNPNMRSLIDEVRHNHDSIMTQSCKNRIEKKEQNKDMPLPQAINGVPYQKIVDLYHKTLPSLPKIKKLTSARKGQIKQRWIQDLKSIDEWAVYFGYVGKSKFLTGLVPANNGHKVFTADLPWLTKESNFVKVQEKKYHDADSLNNNYGDGGI